MLNAEINAAIAEVCGDGDWSYSVPDYCGDLNAIHAAWSRLSIAKQVLACCELERLCYGPCDTKLRVVNASARQKSEAFLRAEGKWKTSSKMTPAQKASRK